MKKAIAIAVLAAVILIPVMLLLGCSGGDGQNRFSNITVTPVTTDSIPLSGGNYEFKLSYDYDGPDIQNYTVEARAGYTNPGFQAMPGATWQSDPATLMPGQHDYDIVIPISVAGITWLKRGDINTNPDLDILLAAKLPMQVVKLCRTFIPVVSFRVTSTSWASVARHLR